jgi:hypothetical protein
MFSVSQFVKEDLVGDNTWTAAQDYRHHTGKLLAFVPNDEDIDLLFREVLQIIGEIPQEGDVRISQKKARLVLKAILKAYGGMRALAFAEITMRELRAVRSMIKYLFKDNDTLRQNLLNSRLGVRRSFVIFLLYRTGFDLYVPGTWDRRPKPGLEPADVA